MSPVHWKPHRARGSLRRWVSSLVWVNLNVSILLVFAVLIYQIYRSLTDRSLPWWSPFPKTGPPGRTDPLLAIGPCLIVAGGIWIVFFIPRRPFARLIAGVIGICTLFCSCIPVGAMTWDVKLRTGVYGLLYLGLSHLLFAIFGDDEGDDGERYQFIIKQ